MSFVVGNVKKFYQNRKNKSSRQSNDSGGDRRHFFHSCGDKARTTASSSAIRFFISSFLRIKTAARRVRGLIPYSSIAALRVGISCSVMVQTRRLHSFSLVGRPLFFFIVFLKNQNKSSRNEK